MSPRTVVSLTGRAITQSPSAVIIGALSGILLVLWWPQLNEWADGVFDRLHPVATGSYEIVTRTDDSVTYALRVHRARECTYGPPPHAYVELPGGELATARIERVDIPAPGISYPAGGTYYSGTWRIWPIVGAVRARMIARYDCGGRTSHSVLADIPL